MAPIFRKLLVTVLRRQIGLRSEGHIRYMLASKDRAEKQCKREENMVTKQKPKLHKWKATSGEQA